VETPPFYKPLNLEIDARVDKTVEMGVGVFKRECIWINKEFGDSEMYLCWQRHERSLRQYCGRRSGIFIGFGSGCGATASEDVGHCGTER
jgi:hypothetical protein